MSYVVADQLADEIVVIDHGRVVAGGTPAELKSRAGARRPPSLDEVFLTLTGHPAQEPALR